MIKRNTIQCSVILSTVQKLQNHPTADQVYEEISKDHPSISRGTVYRNLNRLDEIGQIHKLNIPGGPDHFDHCCSEHYHVKCEKCGRVFDVDMPYVSRLEKNIRDSHGFNFTGYDIIFRGICHDCNA